MKWLVYSAVIVAAIVGFRYFQEQQRRNEIAWEASKRRAEERDQLEKQQEEAQEKAHAARLAALRADPGNITVKGTIEVEGNDLELELIANRTTGAIVEVVNASMDIDSIVDDAIEDRNTDRYEYEDFR